MEDSIIYLTCIALIIKIFMSNKRIDHFIDDVLLF